MGRTVAAIKPEAKPRPRQDSQRDKDAWDAPFPKGSWPSTFTTSAVRLHLPSPLRHWSESQRSEKSLLHPLSALHCASPAKFNLDGANTLRSVTPPSDLPASVREDCMPSNPAQRAKA
ncbi:hypothetical protein LPB072_15270 [Hydrogenophaga crassostreae]|uniref:Uncharacterized protein n=1 Tax=Hydrogenophaga crassostreae TaxID=1763535 RepID=A0A1D8NY67_9BURK|nr:hypothetical protein LPB072_15270 [Hydrogenophaga crassostreae]